MVMLHLLTLLTVIFSVHGKDSQSKIIGGANAVLGDNPYQVSLQVEEGHFCGGSIIDDRWILTAGHCVWGLIPKYVMVGSVTLDPPGTKYEVAITLQKPFFNSVTLEYDIGLVKTKTKIIFNANVQPIPLATDELPDGTLLTATGWGITTSPDDVHNDMKIIDLPIKNNSECKAIWDNLNTGPRVTNDHICVLKAAGQALCVGDTGGPLVYDNKLYGIVTLTVDCAQGYPDVVTKVKSYMDWIDITRFFFSWV